MTKEIKKLPAQFLPAHTLETVRFFKVIGEAARQIDALSKRLYRKERTRQIVEDANGQC